MEFLFCPESEVSRTQLNQGDILIRSKELQGVLAQAHKHYAEAETYTHFAVITQSCDLVRRHKNKPNTRYITIAAMRPASIVVERFLSSLGFGEQQFCVPVYNSEKRLPAEQFIERLVNNTESDVFFVPRGSHPSIAEHMCIFLPLSVALKSEHYEALLASKVAQLSDIFAAKLGWLVGNLYSRIATPDLEEKDREGGREYKQRVIEEALDQCLWISQTQWPSLRDGVKRWKKENPASQLAAEQLGAIAEAVPTQMSLLAERIVTRLKSEGILGGDAEKAAKARKLIENDSRVRTIARLIT